jgi:hypothetical protein
MITYTDWRAQRVFIEDADHACDGAADAARHCSHPKAIPEQISMFG